MEDDEQPELEKLIEQDKLLDDLQFVMLESKMSVRSNAMWVLANMACSEYGAKAIMFSDSSIMSNVFQEIARPNSNHHIGKSKQEAFYLVNNILVHKIPGVIDKMVKNNIIGLIYQDFMEMR